MEEIKIPDSENVWEAVQIITGETIIYHKGFKEEANVKDVIKLDVGYDIAKNIVYQFSRFDFNPARPAVNSTIRLNRSVITFTWYVDPVSEVIIKLKDAMLQMDAKRAGLIIPGAQRT